MAKTRVKDIVEEIAKPIVEGLGLELVDVEFQKEGKDLFLRIYIYKAGGVSIDDCVEVNKLVDVELDRLDPIKEPFLFEVSSPGIDRPFRTNRDFERYAGEMVEVQLFKAMDGKKFFEGSLIGINSIDQEEYIVIDMEGSQREFLKSYVATVKRIIKF